MKSKKTLETTYIIYHGAKSEKDRKKIIVRDLVKACEIFNEKQKTEHVSVYKQTTEVVTEKIYETE